MNGIVSFVGAGPGDPSLITVRGRQLLSKADVVIYAGSLVNEELLSACPAEAHRVSSARMPLEEQVALMGAAASEGRAVVRLHTGDPSVFGAIAEQIRQLEQLGVSYQIVPGVSSAFAAAAILGLEYTLPASTQTIIFTRLAGRTPVPEAERLRDLAAHRSSLVIFLSTGMLASVVEELYAAKYPEDTPVAVVFRASWPDQRVIRGYLSDIQAKVEGAELTHHALIIVSPGLDRERPAATSHLYGSHLQASPRERSRAIIALTRGGVATGKKLLDALPSALLYAPRRFGQAGPRIVSYEESVRQVLQSCFERYQGLVCIMASGIVVRDLAPVLKSKHHDPGVVVLDERGQHAISLLGGHEGGANRLAEEVAAGLGGRAILTTASDVLGLPSLDSLGSELGWRIGDSSEVTKVSSVLVNGEELGCVQLSGDPTWLEKAPPNLVRYDSVAELVRAEPAGAIMVTHRPRPNRLPPSLPSIVYYPPCLFAGVGCNRDTGAEEIIEAIRNTFRGADLSFESLARIATIEDKAHEEGLLKACEALGCPLLVYSRAQIAEVSDLPNPSPWAEKVLGVRGVAEPAALLAADASVLAVEKQKFKNVTVAVAVGKEPG